MLAVAGYGAAVVKILLYYRGVPISRDLLVPVVLVGFVALSITSFARLRRVLIGIAVDWAPFMLALWLYDITRGYADGALVGVQYAPQIRLDELLGGGVVPSLWLQHHLWHGAASVRWYDYATWVVYISYFFGTTAVLVALWWRSRRLFWRFAANVVVLAFAGCLTFLLYPADPPWLAAQSGHIIGPIDRLIGPIGTHVPVISVAALWETGTRYDNPTAAMPSLHASYTLLITLFLVARLRSRWRHLLWLYPPAMTFALVYSGEHYVVDVVAGWIYAAVIYFAIEWALDRVPFSSRRTRTAHPCKPEPGNRAALDSQPGG
jgi:membrane-associated phospholipid phosphatase